ncbi:hypothetical protein SDC9_50713 [bioreactor metagenome]|uniref:Uncharacterized protein n=1 Tax=bioreactor metagenome TaxID=1076179 RepID=A0A644WKL4_9ZZZZ
MSQHLAKPERIAAILPCYSATGDTTKIITTDGLTNTSDVRIRTIVRRLALSRATDLLALKKRAASATQSSILQPLPLTPGLVLCPVKVRTPRVAGDTSTGYINYYAIKSVEKTSQAPYQAIIILVGGIQLPVLWTVPTVNKHLQNARLAMHYAPQHSHCGVHEDVKVYAPEIVPIIQKFVEVICDIVAAKQR